MTISWLLLERYALGELEDAEREELERRLATSSEDRACLEAILHDDTVLPPLPVVLPERSKLHREAGWWAAAAALAAAFALTLLPGADVPSRRSVTEGIKGGEAAITLISERTGMEARKFRDGDRFKLLVTCPPWLSSRMTVVMFQDGQRYQPLANVDAIACGNQVPWPGAFSLDDAGDAEVCVTWGNPNVRAARELEPDAVCQRLEHE